MLYKPLLKYIINAVDTGQGLLEKGHWIIIMLGGFAGLQQGRELPVFSQAEVWDGNKPDAEVLYSSVGQH